MLSDGVRGGGEQTNIASLKLFNYKVWWWFQRSTLGQGRVGEEVEGEGTREVPSIMISFISQILWATRDLTLNVFIIF